MNKEKEIEEMEFALAKSISFIYATQRGVDYNDTAKSMISLGYRKADEVRKETASEICEAVIKKYHIGAYLTDSWVIELAKQYGAELNEE